MPGYSIKRLIIYTGIYFAGNIYARLYDVCSAAFAIVMTLENVTSLSTVSERVLCMSTDSKHLAVWHTREIS